MAVLKVVIDTSVFVAGTLSQNSESSSFQLLERWKQGSFILVTSPQLLRELVIVLRRRGIAVTVVEELIEIISLIALKISGVYETTMLDEIDPNDNMFIAAAYEAKSDFIISLDSDLLNLKYSHGTQIITPAAFLEYLGE